MFNFGFSYVGLIYLLMLFIPNIIFTKNLPKGFLEESKKENIILLIFEKVGQVLTTCCALIFSDFNIRISLWTIILLVSFILMLMYEFFWIRYFKSEKKLSDFYSSVLGIPIAGATLPVIAFLLLGVYGKNIFMIVSSIILGIGHIGIHYNHKKNLTLHLEDSVD